MRKIPLKFLVSFRAPKRFDIETIFCTISLHMWLTAALWPVHNGHKSASVNKRLNDAEATI